MTTVGVMYTMKTRIVGSSLILTSWKREGTNWNLVDEGATTSVTFVTKDTFGTQGQSVAPGTGTYGMNENAVTEYTVKINYVATSEPNTSTETLDALNTLCSTAITAAYPNDLSGITNFVGGTAFTLANSVY